MLEANRGPDMKLEYRGTEQIPVTPDKVWAFVSDPEKIAGALPDVVDVKMIDATHFDAVVKVGVGPVRGKFTMKFELQPDPAAQRVNMKIAGGGFGSAMDLSAGADIVDAGNGATTLNWDGSAEMRGPVAAVGGRVLDAQAQKLIAQTFATVRERLSK
jgi:hypothetical protein